ncbi:MAG TPA: carbonic anhydrase family protein [Thermoanaerobaculia bacterium]|nr:carbonic anhydrase family protein [Thermoanaerobaculia bacterium]
MLISRLCRLAVVSAGLLLAAACVGPPPPPPPPGNCCEVPWSYANQESWATLSPCYFDCGRNGEIPGGGEQSPIDFVNPRQQSLPAVDFSGYGRVPGLKSRNNGHTVRIDIPKGAATLRLDGMVYELQQFHFHAPSEHKIRDNERAMEIHFVNVSERGRVVAVGVFIKDGTSNPELAKIWQRLPQPGEGPVDLGEINLAGLLPSGRTSFRYAGSLTNPPCNQGFQWIVYHDAIDLAQEDVDRFKALFPGGNSRNVQPLNGRVVVTDVTRP